MLLIVLCYLCSGWENQSKNKNFQIYDESILSLNDVNSEIAFSADSISLPEGPPWYEKSNSLLFTDIINNKVLKWNEGEGVSDYLS